MSDNVLLNELTEAVEVKDNDLMLVSQIEDTVAPDKKATLFTFAEYMSTKISGGGGGGGNLILNSDMLITQKGTSFNLFNAFDIVHLIDRWIAIKSGVANYIITQDTDVPEAISQYSLKADCVLADVSVGDSDLFLIGQNVEGYSFYPLIGKQAILSFYVKATKPGIYCVAFNNVGYDRSYVAEYEIISSSVWQKVNIPITFDFVGGTWNYADGIGLRVTFAFMAGADYTTSTVNEWISGVHYASVNQVNGGDSAANDFWISQVQLTEGNVSTPYSARGYHEELFLCKKFYEKIVLGEGIPFSMVKLELNTITFGNLLFSEKRKIPIIGGVTGFLVYENSSGLSVEVGGFNLTLFAFSKIRAKVIAGKNAHGLLFPTLIVSAGTIIIDAELPITT